MPTTLPRTQVTHTPPIQNALALAQARWPDTAPGALLVNLILEGASALEPEVQAGVDQRRQRRRSAAGAFPGVFGPGYLDEIRDGWPE